MRIVPTMKQWRGWSMPAKYGVIGVPLALVLFVAPYSVSFLVGEYRDRHPITISPRWIDVTTSDLDWVVPIDIQNRASFTAFEVQDS